MHKIILNNDAIIILLLINLPGLERHFYSRPASNAGNSMKPTSSLIFPLINHQFESWSSAAAISLTRNSFAPVRHCLSSQPSLVVVGERRWGAWGCWRGFRSRPVQSHPCVLLVATCLRSTTAMLCTGLEMSCGRQRYAVFNQFLMVADNYEEKVELSSSIVPSCRHRLCVLCQLVVCVCVCVCA